MYVMTIHKDSPPHSYLLQTIWSRTEFTGTIAGDPSQPTRQSEWCWKTLYSTRQPQPAEPFLLLEKLWRKLHSFSECRTIMVRRCSFRQLNMGKRWYFRQLNITILFFFIEEILMKRKKEEKNRGGKGSRWNEIELMWQIERFIIP